MVRLVLDNLNTHGLASPYQTLRACRGSPHRKAPGVPLHAKHGSWLNKAGIEFSGLAWACLRGRKADADSMKIAVNANVSERNSTAAATISRFTNRDTRRKLHRPYPCHS